MASTVYCTGYINCSMGDFVIFQDRSAKPVMDTFPLGSLKETLEHSFTPFTFRFTSKDP